MPTRLLWNENLRSNAFCGRPTVALNLLCRMGRVYHLVLPMKHDSELYPGIHEEINYSTKLVNRQ